MHDFLTTMIRILTSVIVTILMSTATIVGQSSTNTTWGDPDIAGIFTFATITPLQRPDNVDGKAILTEEEAASLEERTARERVDRPPRPGDTGTYNRFWVDYGTKVVATKRTSLITDPADGKLPAVVQQVQQRNEASRATGPQSPSGHEDLSITDRCIMGFNAGPPFLPSAYNNTVQIFQTPDYVVILNEMIHDARIIPINGSPNLSDNIRQWLGSSRGYWDQNTLVVETKNFSSGRELLGGVNIWRYPNVGTSDPSANLIERFTRIDAATINYEFTLNDPGTWTQSWSATFPLVGIDANVFEYACHEGNYSAANILSGARAGEMDAH